MVFRKRNSFAKEIESSLKNMKMVKYTIEYQLNCRNMQVKKYEQSCQDIQEIVEYQTTGAMRIS